MAPLGQRLQLEERLHQNIDTFDFVLLLLYFLCITLSIVLAVFLCGCCKKKRQKKSPKARVSRKKRHGRPSHKTPHLQQVETFQTSDKAKHTRHQAKAGHRTHRTARDPKNDEGSDKPMHHKPVHRAERKHKPPGHGKRHKPQFVEGQYMPQAKASFDRAQKHKKAEAERKERELQIERNLQWEKANRRLQAARKRMLKTMRAKQKEQKAKEEPFVDVQHPLKLQHQKTTRWDEQGGGTGKHGPLTIKHPMEKEQTAIDDMPPVKTAIYMTQMGKHPQPDVQPTTVPVGETDGLEPPVYKYGENGASASSLKNVQNSKQQKSQNMPVAKKQDQQNEKNVEKVHSQLL